MVCRTTQLVGDVGAAAAYLRALSSSNQKVGVIGYCSGGRQSVLAACSLDLDAAVDCYGAFVVMDPPESSGMKATSIVPLLPNLSCPLLGLFGLEDQYPSPEQTETLRGLLTENARSSRSTSTKEPVTRFFARRPAVVSARGRDRSVGRDLGSSTDEHLAGKK